MKKSVILFSFLVMMSVLCPHIFAAATPDACSRPVSDNSAESDGAYLEESPLMEDDDEKDSDVKIVLHDPVYLPGDRAWCIKNFLANFTPKKRYKDSRYLMVHEAAHRDDIADVKNLLACGMPFNIKNTKGNTPYACTSSWSRSQKFLGLHKNLFRAAKYGDGITLTNVLGDEDLNVNVRDCNGLTAIWWATINHQNDIVQRLLAMPGINFQCNDHHQRTILHMAAYLHSVEGVHVLLNDGRLAVDALDEKGATPLYLACSQGGAQYHDCSQPASLAIVQALLAAGAAVNHKKNDKDTPLHAAIRAGFTDVARALVIAGADVDCDNDYNESPLSLANLHGQFRLVGFMWKHEAKRFGAKAQQFPGKAKAFFRRRNLQPENQ